MKLQTSLTLRNLLNIRRIAIHNRLDDSLDSYIEKCYRHYSKTYHEALHKVKQELAPEEVALIYMEDQIEDWSVEDINGLKTLLDASDRAVLENIHASSEEDESVDDEVWIAQQNELLKKQDEVNKKKKNDEIVKKTHEAIEQLTKSFSDIAAMKEKKDS